MPYFFDTNVIIGYLFHSADRLGPRAQKRVDDDEQNHAGFTTTVECFGKNGKSGRSYQIFTDIMDEIMVIREQLNEEDFIHFRTTFDPRKFVRTGGMVREYLDSGNISETDKIEEINNLADQFEKAYYRRKQQILNPNICTWHPKRSESYSTLGESLEETITNSNDIQVLLDAYDAGKTIENLLVVTDDYTDILKNKDRIVSVLPTISDIIRP